MKITQTALSAKVDALFNNLIDSSFVHGVINRPPIFFTNTVWAKNVAYSFIPYGLEIKGKKRAKYLRKQLVTATHFYQYNLVDNDIVQVIEQSQSSHPISIEYIFKESISTFCLKVDAQNLGINLVEVVALDGVIDFSLSVDHNKHFSYNEYIYIDGKVRQIVNNENGVERIYDLDYIDNQLCSISSTTHGKTKIHFEI